MKIRVQDETRENIKAFTISGILIAFVCFIFRRWDAVAGFFGKINASLAPFLWGFCIAFIALPVRKSVEKKLTEKNKFQPKTRRRIAVTVAIVVLILILVAFCAILIPQLIDSTQSLLSSMDSYMRKLQEFINGLSINPEYSDVIEKIYKAFSNWVSTAVTGENGVLQTAMQYSVNFVKGIMNFFVGIIVAVYLLADSERWKRQAKRVTYSLFETDHADYICYVGNLIKKALNGFLFGKAIDSLIIGIACWICCLIMKMPYSPLIAVVVGLTNMIPFFGPFIGAVPCIFILLIINPIKALEFTIFIIILQQIDGNILGPHILGDSVGLPALWVMFSILVGGSTFGLTGMLLGVPLFSVIYVLIRDWCTRRLKEKKLRIE